MALAISCQTLKTWQQQIVLPPYLEWQRDAVKLQCFLPERHESML